MRNDRFTASAVVAYERPTAQRRSLVAFLLVMLSGLCMPLTARAASVVAYPLASIYIEGTSWKITGKGADGITVPIKARACEFDDDGTVFYVYAHCAISGSTQFAVDATQTVTSYSISPKGYNITATLSNGTATNSVLNFTLPSSQYIEIKVNSKTTLCLLADPAETNPGDPNSIYNVVTHYSADTTGTTSDTTKIQNAINDANTAGGGTVYFPPGIYLSGKLTIKSHVHMYFAGGSVLRADPAASWGSGSNFFISSPSGSTDVEVYGRGVIDCHGSKIANYLDPQGHPGTHQINPFYSNNTNGVQIYGIIGCDSTAFTIHPGNGSQNVTINNVKIINRQDWNWNDGIDFTDSHNGTVSHCFIKTCDDACCVKTGYFSEVGASHDIAYDDIVADTGVGDGFSIGAETNNDIYNITASNFQVVSCHRGVAVIHENGVGNWHDLHFHDWRIETVVGGETNPPTVVGSRGGFVNCPIHLEIYDKLGNGVGPISNVEFTNLTFDNHGPYASYLWGNDATNNIKNVTFTDVSIAGTAISGYGTLLANKGNTSNITFNVDPSPKSNECELLSYTASGCTPAIYSDGRYSGGKTLATDSTGTGQWCQMTLPSIPAGTYDVQLYYRGRNDHGQFSATMNGVALGTAGQTWDQYNATDTFGLINDLGRCTFYTAGNQTLRITLSGKNPSSTNYEIDLDKVVLIKQP